MKRISLKDRVLNQIENVRDWLDRAEDGYRNDAFLQGEMNLNLAQAELKKAWEESRKLHTQSRGEVIPFAPSVQKPVLRTQRWSGIQKRAQHRYGLVAAVVLMVLVNLTPLLKFTINNHPIFSSTQNVMIKEQVEEKVLTMEGVESTVQADTMQTTNVVSNTQMVSASEEVVQEKESVNQTAYTETSLHFDVKKDQLVYIPVKEVKVATTAVANSEDEVDNQFALESRRLKSVGKNVDKWPMDTDSTTVSNKINMVNVAYNDKSVSKSATVSRESTVVDYDLDQLVNLAKETLTTKR